MIPYLFESAVYWLFFYGFYLLVLERETFFTLNRIYLLITVLLGLAFPLMEFGWWQSMAGDSTIMEMMQPVTVTVSQVGYTLQEIVVTPDAQATNYVVYGLSVIYLLGVVFFTMRLIRGWWGIQQLKNKSNIERKEDFTLIKTDEVHLPFSFFRSLFWSKYFDFSEEDEARILRHELTHIRQYHSVDILLLEIISIIFWFNPMLWFYKKSIRDTHEYLADEHVLIQYKKKQYGQLLLRQMQSGTAFSLTHNFNHSQLKKRFQMMNKNKSSRWAMTRYIWALPVLALLLLAFKASDMIPTDFQQPVLPAEHFHVNQSPGDSIFNKVDQMPTFPGCENVTDAAERKTCADTKMLQYIYSKIRYPELARNNNTQGVVVVRFVINKKGNIASPEIMKSLGDGLDEEVLRVVETMPNWNPGIQHGKKVNVYFNLPVKFKLADDAPAEKEVPSSASDATAKSSSKSLDQDILYKVDQMPTFPGCENVADAAERKPCADQKMLQHIYTKIKYPELARKTGIQGTVVVRFVIDKTGAINNPEILKSIGHGCDAEVLRVVETMPNWNPGIDEGKPVNVYFNLPVKFRLQEDEPATVKEKETTPAVAIGLFVSPNPTTGQVKVTTQAAAQPITIYISDIKGKILKEATYPAFSGKAENTFDLSKLASKGTFFVTIQQGRQVKTEQVVLN